MLDAVFNRTGETLHCVIRNAIQEAIRQRHTRVGSEHLLLGLACQPDNIAARALAAMKIDAGNTKQEVDQYLRQKEISDGDPTAESAYSDSLIRRILSPNEFSYPLPALSQMAVKALLRAADYSYYFGQELIEPAHLLLGILDLPEAGANKIFEELSANLTFLRRQIMCLMANEMSTSPNVTGLQDSVIKGLKGIAGKHYMSLAMVNDLALKSKRTIEGLPSASQVLYMISIVYLADFLYTQVAFQRYLLEELLTLLSKRAGMLDKEISAAIVSSSAQNIRTEVRATIEYLWSHEFRLIQHMFNEAEHDLIGSIIEDLWWAQSEEMALNQSFASALEDQRRTQLLSLQKRRIEIANRLMKLKGRLDDTLKRSFLKRTI